LHKNKVLRIKEDYLFLHSTIASVFSLLGYYVPLQDSFKTRTTPSNDWCLSVETIIKCHLIQTDR